MVAELGGYTGLLLGYSLLHLSKEEFNWFNLNGFSSSHYPNSKIIPVTRSILTDLI